MSKNIVQNVKGTRDFYPQDMVFRNWFLAAIKQVSEEFGYQEFDGPYIEYLDLYADKTSEEILKEQAFSLKDRDGRDILLRPEITPTMARMVAQRSGGLLKPIKWYSFGRAYRYEQPQKGREREFFQWEINVLGPETPEADAEILAIAINFFKKLGLTSGEIVIKVNDRSYFEQFIKDLGIDSKKFTPLLRIIDRKEKVSQQEFEELLQKQGLDYKQIRSLENFFEDKDFKKSEWLKAVFDCLQGYSEDMLDFVVFDPTVTRGLDYYTRTVFEAWDATGGLKRSLFGGGRFDNLTATLGGERVPGVGMAIGDVPMEVLLTQLRKIPDQKPKSAKVLVTVFNQNFSKMAAGISTLLRYYKIGTEIWLDPTSKLDKQLKYADNKSIPYVIIFGPDDLQTNTYVLKDLNKKSQESLSLEEIVEKLKSA